MRVEGIFAKLFCVLATLLFAVLTYFSLVETWVNDREQISEYVYPQPDSMLWNLLGLGIVLLVGILIYGLEKKQLIKGNLDIVAMVLSLAALAFSIYWINGTAAAPLADQYYIVRFAEEFEMGNTSALAQGKYVGIYQQQLGLITFIRVLYKLFGMGNYQAYQYFNAVMIPILIFSGYQIVKQLSEDSHMAELCYLILTAFCLPMYCYVPFVYGEIASTALVIFAGWMLLWIEKKFSVVKVILFSLALGVAVQLRRNVLILVIAFGIVLLVQLLGQKKRQALITLGGMLAGVLLFQGIINGIYAKFIPEDSHSAPASVFIAMGVNSDNGMAGWHNFYDQFAFRDNGYDIEKTNQAAKEYLLDFVEHCKENPGYASEFYYNKMCSQWNAPLYQCFIMTNHREKEQANFVTDIYIGKWRALVDWQMNLHQLVVYSGILGLLLLVRKKWTHISNYVLLIGVFGGFLFSMMWEAKTRYVFPYYLMMLPYAAVGIYELVKFLWSIKLRKTAAVSED
ncbi:MAG: hypothetical protein J6A94_09765 [Lachnospiraceae bacterium]|nr:hypothetical protein [Lachnospiraceae bacterium]